MKILGILPNLIITQIADKIILPAMGNVARRMTQRCHVAIDSRGCCLFGSSDVAAAAYTVDISLYVG